MSFLDLLSRFINWEYVKILLLLVAALWLIGRVRRKSKLKSWIETQAEKHLSPKLAPRKRLLEAKRAEKKGDWAEAGFIYDQMGELDKALDCFEKAEDYSMCGELCIRMGRKDYAAEWFLLAEEPKRAAELFRDAGLYDRAAEIFLEVGLSLDAASAFFHGGQHVRAGEIYETSGNYVKAGDAFEKAEDYARAAENYARQIAESGGAEGRYMGGREREELARLSGRAAYCYQKRGELEKAADILKTGGQYGLAAQVAEKLGQYRRAAELYQKSGDVQKAAELYDRAGDRKTAASLVGDQQLHAGDQEAAAESFLASGDAIRAAEIFEGLGRYDRAAQCYASEEAFAQAADASLRANDKASAARYFERAKLNDRAAELYAELGHYEEAAKLFADTGRYFDAAKAAAETNCEALMVEYLQRVTPDDENYLAAVLQLARSFVIRGWSSLAIEKLNSVLENQAIRSDNLELWNVLARAYEAEGELNRASELLHNMMSVQYDYQDIRERHAHILEKIEEQRRREATLKSSPSGGRGDRYALETLLGRGGMGAVYKAYDRLLRRSVAYKVLSGEFSSKPKARDQLLNEARAAAALNHPNIITIFDIGLEGDKAFICMELIEGESYADILRKKKMLTIPEAMHFLVSVCQGLDHAHQRGIVHRDLKPSNILLTKDNRLKIVDFGLAQPIEDFNNSPPGTSLSGTPRYISPEQARGDPTDARSDVYSLGATLYNVLVGHAPFTDGNLVMHHLYTPPPPLRSERTEIPPSLEELVLLCLSKHPAERYQTAGEVLSFASAARLL